MASNRQTPLELALHAWNDSQSPQSQYTAEEYRQAALDSALALGETGMFSKRQIALICDLPLPLVNSTIVKNERTGGRFNPEHLPLIHDLALAFEQGVRDRALCRAIVGKQTSAHMVSRLTGIPLTTVERWTKKEDES